MDPSNLRAKVLRLRMPGSQFHVSTDSSGKQFVVCTEKADPLTTSFCDALVPGVIYAAIRLASPECNSIVVRAQHFDSSVAGSAIKNYVFDVWIILDEYAIQAPSDMVAVVIDGRHNRNQGFGGSSLREFALQPRSTELSSSR
jgi:hypothetical protein